MAGLIGLSLLLCVLPAMAESITYGVVTSDNVNVRRAGKISAKLWFQVDAGHVAQILSRTTAQEDGSVWYKVSTAHPQPNGHTYIGYIHGDFFRPMTQAETEQYLKGQGQLLPSSPPETDGGVQLSGARGKTLGGTNFRDQPSTRTGRIMQVIPGGTEIDILALPTGDGEWYRAAYKGVIGYVHTGMVRLVTSGETAEPEAADAVITTASGVNLRLAPGGKSIAQVPHNTVMTRVGPVLSPQESGTDYTWYGVRYEGMHGYIRGDCVREYTGGAAQEPSHPPAEDSDRTGTGRLLKNTNFRDQPTTASGSRIMAVIRAGTMVEVRSVP